MTRQLLRFALLPLVGYIACYFILTYPLVLFWADAYFCDQGDGPQMIWDVWWIKHALLDLHQLPWHTDMLHYPHGVTLLLHSVTPFNGLLGIPLSWVLPPVQVYNALVTFTFAASGLTAFWLAYRSTSSYLPSLAAGYAFAFCSYRFAHAYGHLQLISTEWIPLFLLVWLRLLDRPSVLMALAAAVTLFLNLLCDHYLFMFCVYAAGIAVVWHLWRWRGLGPWRSTAGGKAMAAFILLVSLSSGPLVWAMLMAGYREPLVGLHNPELYSADLLGIFVPGWQWHYHGLTRPIWRPMGNYNETSISIGLAVLAAAIAGWMTRGRTGLASAGLWLWMALIFAAFALGPTLNIWATPVTRFTPYRLLEMLLPPLKLAGCPGRMMIMTQLACAVMAAAGLKALAGPVATWRVLAGTGFVLAMAIESQPHLQATFDPKPPQWVQVLRDAEEPGAVVDLMTLGDSLGLYYQTIHGRPITGGCASRLPVSVEAATQKIIDQALAGEYQQLAAMGFRFVVAGASRKPMPLPVVHEDRLARVYRIPPTRQASEPK